MCQEFGDLLSGYFSIDYSYLDPSLTLLTLLYNNNNNNNKGVGYSVYVESIEYKKRLKKVVSG